MNREEKRVIRKQICRLLENECKNCENKRSYGETPVHCITVCPVGIKMQSLSNQLIQDERKKKSNVNTFNEGPWSQEEEFYLLNHMNLFKLPHLSKRLNRNLTSISRKAYFLRRRYPELLAAQARRAK